MAVEYSILVPSSPRLITSTKRIMLSSDAAEAAVLSDDAFVAAAAAAAPPNVLRNCRNTVGGSNISFMKCSSLCGKEQKIGFVVVDDDDLPSLLSFAIPLR